MPDDQPRVNPYHGLRKQAIEVSASELGLNGDSKEPYGVLMETAHPGAVVTLLSLLDGTTSLYFSNGGGLIGGIGHAAVRAASQKFVAAAGEYTAGMTKADHYPLPKSGEVRFYVLTPSGVLTYHAQEHEMSRKGDRLRPLFYSGQDVITEMRRMSEERA